MHIEQACVLLKEIVIIYKTRCSLQAGSSNDCTIVIRTDMLTVEVVNEIKKMCHKRGAFTSHVHALGELQIK